jgi:hypothetical protein
MALVSAAGLGDDQEFLVELELSAERQAALQLQGSALLDAALRPISKEMAQQFTGQGTNIPISVMSSLHLL